MISFARISKQYGRQVLFVEASFQLNPGEKAITIFLISLSVFLMFFAVKPNTVIKLLE